MPKISSSLRLHRYILFLLYISTIAISFKLLFVFGKEYTIVESLSSGAILATFGSAIATIGTIWTGDHEKRILLNFDILTKDIMKQDTAWRRWPFLARKSTSRTYGKEYISGELKNPDIELDVGSHKINVTIPSIQEDFFDLGICRNLYPLLRFRKAALTKIISDESLSGDRFLSYSKYNCILDIWKCVFIFRFARYIIHFGVGLTISSAIISGIVVL